MRRLLELFALRPMYSWALIGALIVLGLLGYTKLNKSYLPELPSTEVRIEISYPGATPEEIEEGITLKIEQGLVGVPGIEEITSTSRENLMTMTVFALQDYPVEKLYDDVKNAVDRITALPDGAEKPTVYIIKPTDRVIGLVLYGESDLMALKDEIERIEDEFLFTGFISQTAFRGLPSPEISIQLREEDVQRYGLSFTQIAQRVAETNRDLFSGSLRGPDEELSILTRAKTSDPDSLANIVIRAGTDGQIVRLGDIADIRWQFEETPEKLLYNGKNSVGLQINKLPEEDLLLITDYVHQYVEDYNKDHSDLKLNITFDRSTSLEQRIELLTKNGLIGLILVLIVLGLFLNLRLAFWVAFGIPVSFLGMLFVGSLAGITINQITLFGMILVIGILVDDGIVISENIYSQREKGKPPLRAAVEGTLQVLPSVTISIMTTVLAFSLFFFVEGRLGDFMPEMATVVIACLLVSLVEATFTLPTHLSSPKLIQKPGPIRRALNRGIDHVRVKLYGRMIEKFTAPGTRWIIYLVPYAFIALVFGMIRGGVIGRSFFPDLGSDEINVELVLSPGTREMHVEKVLRDIDKKVWALNDSLEKTTGEQPIVSTQIEVGLSSFETGSHAGKLEIELLDGETRTQDAQELTRLLRQKIGKVPGARKFAVNADLSFGKPVSLRLVGTNANELESAKSEIKAGLEEIPSLRDIVDSDVLGKRELRLSLKPQAYYRGLDEGDILTQIRQAFFGLEAQRIQVGQDEVRVWVRYPPEDRQFISDLMQMRVESPTGNSYPLSEMVDYQMARGVVSIKHYNGMREILVEGSLANSAEPLGPVISFVEGELLPPILARYPSVRIVPSGQQRQNEKFFSSIIGPTPLLILLGMWLLISLPFGSFVQGRMVMRMIWLGIAGAFLGHWLEGKNVVIMSYFGMIAVAGVVINDAVVFMDRYNQLLREGMTCREAAVQTGIDRFRAIILTSITTVVGLYPIIFETSRQAQFLIPMAIAVAYGVLFGTIFILLILPSYLLVTSDMRRLLYRFWTGRKSTAEELEPVLRARTKRQLLDEEHNQ